MQRRTYKSQYLALDRQAEVCHQKQEKLLADYAKEYSPLKAGDIIKHRQDNGKIVYWRVLEIHTVFSYSGGMQWYASGRECKANGNPTVRKINRGIRQSKWRDDMLHLPAAT